MKPFMALVLLLLLVAAPVFANTVVVGGGGTSLPTSCSNGQVAVWNSTTQAWDTCAANAAAGSGDVVGPATNTDAYVPQWNGANSKILKNGFGISANGITLLGETFAQMLASIGAQADIGLTAKSDSTSTTSSTTAASSTAVKSAYDLANGKVSMVYPGSGVPVSTGSAWGTSLNITAISDSISTTSSTTSASATAVKSAYDLANGRVAGGGSLASPGAAIGTGTPVAITGTTITGTSFVSTPVDGSNKITLSNNTTIAPTASSMELYPEENIWKLNQNGTEYSAVLSPTGGQATIAGFSVPRTITFTDANTSIPAVPVGTTDAQALTNKNMSGAGNTWPDFNQNTSGMAAKATNLVGGNATTLLGSIGYQSAADTTTLLGPNTTTTKMFLRQTGTGTNGAIPAWDTLASGDIPANAANTSGTAANVSGTPALPNGTTATTQTAGDNSTKLATTAYVDKTNNIGTFSAPITTAPYTLTAANTYNSVLWYGATNTVNLPAAVAGMATCIYNTGAFTITIDPNGSDVVVRDGTIQTGGVSFTLSTGAGNYVCIIADAVNHWVTLGYKGTLGAGS